MPAATVQRDPEYTHGRREGNRWIGNPPDPAEFATWFKESVKLHHEDLDHDQFVGGIVLIPQEEKVKRVRRDNNAIVELPRLAWTPYAKVETRLDYFWTWCRLSGYLGEIEPVLPRDADTKGLAPGMYWLDQPDGRQSTRMVVCSMQVRVHDPYYAIRTGGKGRAVMCPPPGTKQLKPVAGKSQLYADPNLLMKVETGAVGRALGMAGMLVIPGSGVATAEDMAEFVRGAPAEGDAEPDLPPPSSAPPAPVLEDPRKHLAELILRLESEAPAKADEVAAWAREKKINLTVRDGTMAAITDGQLRPALRKVEAMLA
jgi:hypothetical protein